MKNKIKFPGAHILTRMIVGLMMTGVLFSCGKSRKPSPDDLVTRKKILQHQIDSLKRELVKIERRLRDTVEADIPAIPADTIEPQEFRYYIDLQGTVKSDGDINIMPLFQGEVVKIYKNVGDKVKKGDVIMKLDDKILRNQIAEVRTQYKLARTAYERQRRLWNQKIGSEMAYLQAKTQYESLRKKLATLNEQLKRAVITAPVEGTVDELMIKEGETAMPGRPVARVVNLDKTYVEADVSERYLKDITPGKPVILEFPEAGITRETEIHYTGNFIHPSNRTFKIRINTPNPEGLLKPNLTARIKVLSRKVDSALVVPVAIIQEDAQGRAFVFVLDSIGTDEYGRVFYRVRKQPVKTALVYNKRAWIEEGLRPGDKVALTGAMGLTEGDKVYIKEEEEE